jgi:hypothetical protein
MHGAPLSAHDCLLVGAGLGRDTHPRGAAECLRPAASAPAGGGRWPPRWATEVQCSRLGGIN